MNADIEGSEQEEAGTEPVLARVSLTIGGESSKPFKSISSLSWEDIPPFAVLTGPNGSGKTQLLELLAYKLSGTRHYDAPDINQTRVEITGIQLKQDEVAYVPSRWEFTGAIHIGLAQMQDAKRQLYQQLQQNDAHNIQMNVKRAELLRLLGLSHISQISPEEFATRLPDDFAFMLDSADVTSGLGHVFLAYRMRFAEALEKEGANRDSIRQVLGPAPWDLVNEILRVAEFPYQVVSPMTTKWTDVYQLQLSAQDGKSIRPADLSSGEKMLLGIALWLYNSTHHNRFPRLFLLDEPDAHLHPSMTRQFLAVLKDVLVERYGVRIILTTHSPSTVALAPPESIFEMVRGTPKIQRSASKQSAIGLLTAGLVTVSEGSKYVLVEDQLDADFYEAVRDILTDYGPSRDPEAIDLDPTLVFLPASRGQGAARVGGGCTVVKQWVSKLDGDVLKEIFRGVIDRDVSNAPSERIEVIGRYSIENYLLDPFAVYGLLSALDCAPHVPGVALSLGDEHLIRALDAKNLQAIVDTIADKVQGSLDCLAESDLNRRQVVFTSGLSCSYPAWMLDRRGHDLLPAYQAVFGGASRVSPPNLLRSLRRVRLVPRELAELMRRLQK
ncbi:AAA family ATPase [Lysobacter niastensis]|uniref:ATP-binding protein n=1 Tax=Lysobacter niastensis TaxID=380629 RepID=A0ABS0B8E4_9GAMM|nr:ATP-binding protein [Lysobacter niastensis]MBF6025112.1 ATP-binding protein [Lysobacter niastensis]